MTAATAAKAAGLKGLNVVSEMTGKPRSTLNNWFNNERDLFDVVVAGCVATQKAKGDKQ